jgi:hypothetical protein
MNIIKLKDSILTTDLGYTQTEVDLFNNYLKGKYAWWIGMKYVVPMRDEQETKTEEKLEETYNYDTDTKAPGLGVAGYIACEQDINNLLGDSSVWHTDYIDSYAHVNFLGSFADMAGTDTANNITLFCTQNKYVTDPDITLDELKKFRTWLATQLLAFNPTDANEKHVLEYYKSLLFDDVCKWLNVFNSTDYTYDSGISTSTCGCHGLSNLSSLYSTSVSVCDALDIYRKNIYALMVELFSDMDYWIDKRDRSSLFISEFKKYIDNILTVGLELTIEDSTNIEGTSMAKYTNCNCAAITKDERGTLILQRLSVTLGYLIDNDLEGHKNFIASAFSDWATYLYEHMYWV